MTPKQARPLGITLLAISLLWIGCGGAIFIPLMFGFSGDEAIWRDIAGGVIHSGKWLRITSYGFSVISYLLYVFYAVIGFGLLKLWKWARKSLLILFVLVSLIGMAHALTSKEGTFVILFELGVAFFPAVWMVWYLQRPGVRFAFCAWPSVQGWKCTTEPPRRLSKAGRLWVAAAMIFSFVLCSAPLAIEVENGIRSSDIYQLTLKEAQASPCVVSTLGVPIRPGWMTTGDLADGNQTGSVSLRIPVHGQKENGTLEMSAEKSAGAWKFDSLVLYHGSARIVILPTTSASSCQ